MLRERIERPSLLLHNSAFTTKLSEPNLNKNNFLFFELSIKGTLIVESTNVGHIFIYINSTYFRNL